MKIFLFILKNSNWKKNLLSFVFLKSLCHLPTENHFNLYQYFNKFINSFTKICIPLKIHVNYLVFLFSSISFKRTLITKRLSLKPSFSSFNDTTYHHIETYIFHLFIKLSEKSRNVYESTSTTFFPSMENQLEFLAHTFNTDPLGATTVKMRDTLSAR